MSFILFHFCNANFSGISRKSAKENAFNPLFHPLTCRYETIRSCFISIYKWWHPLLLQLGAIKPSRKKRPVFIDILNLFINTIILIYLFFSPSPSPPCTLLLHIPLITVVYEYMLIYAYTHAHKHVPGVSDCGEKGD